MKYIVSINDKNYEVEVERGEARIVKTTQAIHVDTAPVAAAPPAPASAPAAAPAAPAAAVVTGEGEAIRAPLPGTVLAVKVDNGAQVKKGEILLIIEAMKMENEIVAPKDGVVTQIAANKGTSVNTGDVLIVLK